MDRGWDGWMASLTWWTWVWASSRSWWWTEKSGRLQSMGWQSPWGHNWATELNWWTLSWKPKRTGCTEGKSEFRYNTLEKLDTSLLRIVALEVERNPKSNLIQTHVMSEVPLEYSRSDTHRAMAPRSTVLVRAGWCSGGVPRLWSTFLDSNPSSFPTF